MAHDGRRAAPAPAPRRTRAGPPQPTRAGPRAAPARTRAGPPQPTRAAPAPAAAGRALSKAIKSVHFDHGNVVYRAARRHRSPQPLVTLLESFSPYGSRKVTVEDDGLVTAAYLHDDASAISATWIADHRPAPQGTDQARLDAGRAPLMLAGRPKHPGGRPPLQAGALEALWFEEGDGVAILEHGGCGGDRGWFDMDRGMPGDSSEVIGQTPFGWSLDDAMEGLAPRLERSRAYWRWRQSAEGWSQFQHALLGHLQPRLGPGGHYWDASAGK